MTTREVPLGIYLDEKRAAVEETLDGLLPEEDAPPETLHRAMRYSVFSGGKRLRPILAIASYGLLGGAGKAIAAPACATELVHTYSLIHDDLPAMDDDDLRRGRPTCHREFGEAAAILAGDALLTLAFEIVASEERLDAPSRLAVIRELAFANGSSGMVGGQVADLEGEGRDPSVEAIEFIHTRKTALPLRAAVRIGALAAGASGAPLEAMTTFGAKLGLAFQIADDILDVTGTAEEMGKAVGKDGARGKMTYPAVVGLDEARSKAEGLIDEASAALDGFGDDAWALRAIAEFVVRRRH